MVGYAEAIRNCDLRLLGVYAASRINPNLKGSTKQFGSLQASATKTSSVSIRSANLATIYAALFLTEGIGLWFEKRWAEWLTVIITSSLVPIEIYEIAHHTTAVKITVLLINIAIVAYLVYRIRDRRMR